MSRLRVHELAKELNLENKAVLDLCAKLGISGKQSHSNSLTDDEADKIRRSVLRQNVTATGDSTRDVSVNGGVATETRMGNVIRRRRKAEDEMAASAEPERTIDLKNVPSRSVNLDSSSPDYASEKQQRDAALARADALFQPASTHADSEMEQDDSSDSAAPIGDDDSVQADVEAEGTEDADYETTDNATDQSAAGVDAGAVDATTTTAAAVTAGDAAGAASVAASAPRAGEPKARTDGRGPRILGRIELPTRPAAPARPANNRRDTPARGTPAAQAAVPGAAEPAADAEARERRKKKGVRVESDADSLRRHKPKKQILGKAELVDYGSDRDSWRSRRDPKRGKKGRGDGQAELQASPQAKASKRIIKIPGEITLGELAKNMGAKVGEAVMQLMNLGVKATINQLLDFDTATILAEHFNYTTVNTSVDEGEVIATMKGEDDPTQLVLRPPVVTVMGHVDHGKTSLLDAIRKTSVTTSEAGGITQHIGAYNVKLPSGGSVTFLDTPGHAAFTQMRSRGAKITDVVVLVVAADDGVMPQTIEAINHAKAAGVPIIVAVNKVDKESANPDRVRNQLSEHGLISEEWGGETIMVPVSAHTKKGIDTLLENLLVQAEVLELRANPNRDARGVVVESKLDKGRGPVMTVLVQNGTLKKGDVFLAGASTGRVRALVSDDGRSVESVGPGMPVEVLGASVTPNAGDEFLVFKTEAEAKQIAEMRQQRNRVHELMMKGGVSTTGRGMTLEAFSEMIKKGDVKELPIILKADVHGSVEALREAMGQLSNPDVQVRVIHAGVGAVTENDVQLAGASGAVIFAFNVRADNRARVVAEQMGADIRFFRIIYELIDSLKAAMSGLLAPIRREKTLGRVEVRQTFKVPRIGMVAGSYVVDGVVERGAQLRLLRDNRVVFEGKMSSLRRFKDDVKEVASGYECGIGIEGYADVKEGDIIEVYKIEEVKPELNLGAAMH